MTHVEHTREVYVDFRRLQARFRRPLPAGRRTVLFNDGSRERHHFLPLVFATAHVDIGKEEWSLARALFVFYSHEDRLIPTMWGLHPVCLGPVAAGMVHTGQVDAADAFWFSTFNLSDFAAVQRHMDYVKEYLKNGPLDRMDLDQVANAVLRQRLRLTF